MRNSYPLAYVAAFCWPVLAAAVSFGQVAATPPGAAPNVVAAATARIAVLPFVATNPQAGNAWIGKSVQQSLSADLLQAAPSRVQTADAVANTSADAVAAGRQLGVNYVVFGTYSSTDQALRIVGQVVDVVSGTATNSLKATGKLGDVFAMEDDLSHQARTAIFGQAPADNGPAYTVHDVPANNAAPQTYTPPNGAPTYVDSSTGYAYPAQAQDNSQYVTAASAGASYSYPVYSYSYYSYPTYAYAYPYYGYCYPGLYFGWGYYGGRYCYGGRYGYGYGGGRYYGGSGGYVGIHFSSSGGGGGGFHGSVGGGFHGSVGGGFHGGGGGHR